MATMNTLEQQLAAANRKPPPKAEVTEVKESRRPVAAKAQKTAADTDRTNKAHIGAWLHKDFRRSLMLVRAQTGEEVQTIIARALNAEFRAQKVPVVEY